MLQKTDPQNRAPLLEAPLNPALVQERRGGGNATFEYISGSIIIDQANRIFGYGNWAFDHETPEPFYDLENKLVAFTCKAKVTIEATTITDEGSGRVAWPRDGGNPNADSLITARKGSITDAKRRCFRNFGSQFGNDLYNDNQFRNTVSQYVISRLVSLGYEQRRAQSIITAGYNGKADQVPINRSILVLMQALDAVHAERAKPPTTDATVDGQATEPAAPKPDVNAQVDNQTNITVSNDAPAADAAAQRPADPALARASNPARPAPAGATNTQAQTAPGNNQQQARQPAARQPQAQNTPPNQDNRAQDQQSPQEQQAQQTTPAQGPQPAEENPQQGRANPVRRQPAPTRNNQPAAQPAANTPNPEVKPTGANGSGSDYMDTPDEDPFS